MQKLLLAIIFIFHLAFSKGQDSLAAPYLRFPTFPPVKLLLIDSSHFFTKADLSDKKKTMIVIFNPQCDHCQHEAETLSQQLDKLSKVQILMVSTAPLWEIKAFAANYNLANKPAVQFAQDTHFFLFSFYNLRSLPFHAFYDKKKQFISAKEGSMTIDKILVALSK
jgi:thiol-disulfide isomerase/thioredoxin